MRAISAKPLRRLVYGVDDGRQSRQGRFKRTALRALLLNPDLQPGSQATLNTELVALLTYHAARFAAPAYEAVQARATSKTASNKASLAKHK